MKEQTLTIKTSWEHVLNKHAGSIKGIKRLNKEEKEKLAEKHTPEEGKAMLKHFGFS